MVVVNGQVVSMGSSVIGYTGDSAVADASSQTTTQTAVAEQTTSEPAGAPGAQSAPYGGTEDPGQQVIGPDFKDGSGIPGSVQDQILKGAPGLKDAASKARLFHATPGDVAAAAKTAGLQPSEVGAFARGTKIFAPPGKGLGLGTLAHEVKHVGQFLSVSNYGQAYQAALQRGLGRGLSLRQAYIFNLYEVQSRTVQRAVIQANSP